MAIAWKVGDRIYGRWEIRQVRRGGMGEVYVVYDQQWKSVLAAKTFQDDLLAQHPGLAEAFVREARTWVALDVHVNVTRAHLVRKIEGKPYLFLEHVSGGTLRDWIGTPRLVGDLAQVLRFALQVCDGMSHVLGKGVQAHCDLKPANCLITQGGTLKVSDFGLARAFEEAAAPALSRAAGTWAYMAPERFDQEGPAEARGDIYALGIMLFEMLTGQVPFAGQTWKEYAQLHRRYSLPALPAFARRPAALRRLVQSCAAKEPGERYADFAQVREELAEVFTAVAKTPAPASVRSGELDRVSWTHKGVSLAELGRHEEALECFAQALARREYVPALASRGASLLALGRHEEALECLDRALELDRRYAPAWVHMGMALAALGKHQEAEKCHTRALELDRHYAPAWTCKGVALAALGRHREALRFHGRALELNPWYAAAWVNRGRSLFELGQSRKALWCHNQALERDPWHAPAWTDKGIVLAALGKYREALVCCDRALELDQDCPLAWTAKGRSLAGVRRWEEALDCYARALELDETCTLARLHQGLALAALDEHREALDSFDRVLELERNHVLAWLYKGVSLAALGQAGQALACCNRALRLDLKCGPAWYHKGLILTEGLRRHQEAAVCFEKANRLGFRSAAPALDRRRKRER